MEYESGWGSDNLGIHSLLIDLAIESLDAFHAIELLLTLGCVFFYKILMLLTSMNPFLTPNSLIALPYITRKFNIYIGQKYITKLTSWPALVTT